MKMIVLMAIIASLTAILSMIATGAPTITIYTDAEAYCYIDTIEVALAAQNFDAGVSVSVYIALLTPKGWIYTLGPGGWSGNLEPWIADIYIPCPFNMNPTPLWWLELPCQMPPIEDVGDYNFAALLTYAGTFDFVNPISYAPFRINGSCPGTDIDMVYALAGSFLMGSPVDEQYRQENEGPQRTVAISEFMMSEVEVTERQWEDVMGWNEEGFSKGDDYPVRSVTWFDCLLFCNRLSEAHDYEACYIIENISQSGEHIEFADVTCDFTADGYRLPTEGEWEFACRAGTTTRYYTGDSDASLYPAAWHYGSSGSVHHPVGEKAPSAWGLYDMHGNLWEWCWDWYDSAYYGTAPDPGLNPTGPGAGATRVIRGGGWNCLPRYCRSAYRNSVTPGQRFGSVGFRVVRQP
ncbi:formylglycine-generating enzyme family protein [bacterium]|nr:formylglycine-generating enzyme family protein [bacterium]